MMIRKRLICFLLGLVFLFQSMVSISFAEDNGNNIGDPNVLASDIDYASYDSSTKPEGMDIAPIKPEMTKFMSLADSQNDILIIQSNLPWNSDASEQILNQNGLGFDKVGIDAVPPLDLGKYKMILVSNDQNDAFYRSLSSLRTKLE